MEPGAGGGTCAAGSCGAIAGGAGVGVGVGVFGLGVLVVRGCYGRVVAVVEVGHCYGLESMGSQFRDSEKASRERSSPLLKIIYTCEVNSLRSCFRCSVSSEVQVAIKFHNHSPNNFPLYNLLLACRQPHLLEHNQLQHATILKKAPQGNSPTHITTRSLHNKAFCPPI